MPNSKGFTLIELLVTISIIAILSAIGLVIYSNVIKQGRDSKRQSDLRSIQSALEQYYSDQGFYPSLLGSSFNSFSSPLTSSIGNRQSPLPSPVKTYLNNVPNESLAPFYGYMGMKDRSSTNNDCDNATIMCSSYCLYAKLENTSPGVGSCPASGSYNFAVTPP